MKTNQILAVGIIGVVAYMLLSKRNRPTPPVWYNPNSVPPQPPNHAPVWLQWANSIIATFGAASWLWAEGGPFHKVDPKKVYDALPPDDPNKQNWNDPYSVPSGWV